MANKMAMLALFSAVLLLATISMSDALSCYVGSSGTYTRSTNCTVCKKTTSSYSGFGISASADASTCESFCSAGKTSAFGANVGTYCCSTDLCNTAAVQTVSVVGLVIASLTVLLRAL